MFRFIWCYIFQTTILLFIYATTSYANINFVQRDEVQSFIYYMVKKHDFNQESLVKLFSQVKVRPQVIQHMSKPLEKEPWRLYQTLFVNEWRIAHGVKFWDKYQQVLQQAEKIFGVPAAIIVATIGIETKYGQRTGEYRVIDSLSNLAFGNASSRSSFFRHELEEFLLLTREQHLNPLTITGSYAGAIGQPQFMPSSYRHYAVNFSGSGTTDLINDEIDVIGSIANYYSKHGWIAGAPVAAQAIILGNEYNILLKENIFNRPLTLATLKQYGITPKHVNLPKATQAKIIELDNRYSKEYWFGFHNFDVIKRYNASDLYAMAVFQLSYYIAARRNQHSQT